jgi:amino acid adenylation domain-containing protein
VESTARCLHELIAAQAARTPDSVAVLQDGAAFTYAGLDLTATRLAHCLIERGVGPEVPVAVLTNRSFESLAGILGVLKAGGCYVPLDPAYPARRIAHILADCGARILLVQSSCLERLPPQLRGDRVIVFLDELAELRRYGHTVPLGSITSDNLAYIIYTSGSTGDPKGVLVTHAGLARYVLWAATFYEVGRGWGAPINTSFGFDATVTSLFAPLVSGAGVRFSSRQDLEWLSQCLSDHLGYGLIKLTPAHLRALARMVETGAWSFPRRLGAHVLVIGGERLTGRMLQAWAPFLDGTRFINEYGPTECVVGCCIHEISATDLQRPNVPIGSAVAGARLRLLDPRLNATDCAEQGELYIGGPGLARGYTQRPGSTAERFLPDPDALEPGARMYRSGDIARYSPQGQLEFVGRRDSQIKLHGHRVEVGEIEVALERLDEVREAIVELASNRRGDACLVAYVALRNALGTFENRIRSVRKELQEVLPTYMLPNQFMELHESRLTVHGKVDRAGLR